MIRVVTKQSILVVIYATNTTSLILNARIWTAKNKKKGTEEKDSK